MVKTPIGLLCGCAALVCLFATASVLPAKPGVVKTRDGQTIEGEIKEEAQSVTVTRRKIPIVIQRADIESIAYPAGTIEEQFQERLSKLEPTDVPGRIELARWAFDQDQYQLARTALEQALTLEPRNREANALMDNVRLQQRLERSKAGGDEARPATAPTTGAVGAAPSTRPATSPQSPPDPRNLLTLDDINTIRQRELREGETNVRINFAKDVKKRFAQMRNMRVQDFNALTPFAQLQDILEFGTPEMRNDVRIVSDPPALLEYRRSVQPLVLQSCATTGCHGAAGAGGFMLFNPAENEAVTYTNFYLLSEYVRSPGDAAGPFGAGQRRMIDRVEPNRSLLLQYGLPASIAEEDHPKVNGLRVVFRTRDEASYRRLFDWIGSSLHSVKPEYGISYTPPQPQRHAAPATAPTATTVPATTPAAP